MINLVNVYKSIGDFSLSNINLSIDDNEYFVILGPTGSGKSVVLEIISGMYKPDEGEVWINGINVTKEYPEERHIGYVYQDYMLFPHLNVQENIIFALKLKKIHKNIINQKLEQVIELLNIEPLLKRYPSTLSGGEQQRVAIARALVAEPEVLLLDEPLSALDPRSKEIFQQELKKIHEQTKTTTIHITHDFNEALVLADRIGIMHDGKIEQVGNPKDVFLKPMSRFVAEFVGMKNIYNGEIMNEGTNQYVRIDSVYFSAVTELKGQVRVAIHPEDIIILSERFTNSEQNMINAHIVEIIPQGSFLNIILDGGITMVAMITRRAFNELNLKIGQEVWAFFKTTAVHIF